MTDRRGTKIYRGTKSEVEADTSTSLYGTVFVSTDRYTLTFVDDNGDHQPIVPSINDVATAAGVDSANDYLLMYDASAGVETKVTIDNAVSAAVAGTDLAIANKTATTIDVTSSTGTDATIPQATTSTAGLLTGADKTKLDGIEAGAEVNNISDINASDLTDAGESSLHYHSSDRSRTNHTGTQTASTISDFDTEVSNNASVAANTAKISADGSINTHSDVDVTTSTPATGDRLYYNGSDWVPRPPVYTTVRNTTSGQTAIGATQKKLHLTSTLTGTGTGDFTLSVWELTFLQAGYYKITADGSINDTSASGDVCIEVRVDHWNGSAFTTIEGTRKQVHCNGSGSGGTWASSFHFTFAVNDRLRVTAVRTSGISTGAYQEQNSTFLTAERVL